jgi:hypothetical protein
MAGKLRKSYNEIFWDDIFGRFIGCVDAWGERHDYGFTFINQQAAFYGLEWGKPLVNTSQLYRMYDWMEKEPTSSGLKDTFSQWIYAARANTDINSRHAANMTAAKDWWVAKGEFGNEGYEKARPWDWCGVTNGQLQNGGCSVYTSYHDLMARNHFINADNAERRFREILDRWSLPDHICGGKPLFLGEYPQQENPGSVGTDYPFPETGMVPTYILYGLMGMNPRRMSNDTENGLAAGNVLLLDPKLPGEWNGYKVININFGGSRFNITVNTTHVTIIPHQEVDQDLQLTINDTRNLFSDLVNNDGKIIIEWDPREAELQEKREDALEEYNQRLSSGKILDLNGINGLAPVPNSSLVAIRDWWNDTVKLMDEAELQAITDEIDRLNSSTCTDGWHAISARIYIPHVQHQRKEAIASLQRGDLRWVLGNYRQAAAIHQKLERAHHNSIPTLALQFGILPGMACIAIISVAWLVRSRGRGIPS